MPQLARSAIGFRTGYRPGYSAGLYGDYLGVAGRGIVALAGQSQVPGVSFVRDGTLRSPLGSFAAPFPGAYMIEQMGDAADPPPWEITGGVARGPYPSQPRPAGGVGDGSFNLRLAQYVDHSAPNRFHYALYALGGSTMTNWKNPSSYPATLPRLIDRWIAFLQACEVTLQCSVVLFNWDQGTSDALDTTLANGYGASFDTVYSHVHPLWPTAPWLINQLCSTSGGGANLVTVTNSKAAFVAAHPGTTALVSAEGLPLLSQVPGTTVHYNMVSDDEMGRRIGAAALGILGIPEIPQAEFRYAGNGTSVSFFDLSEDRNSAVSSWAWTFGDGGTSTQQNPTHSYSANGVYTATLAATAANGLSNTISHDVRVATRAWTVDATDGNAYPANSAEWTALLAAAIPSSATSGNPTGCWPLQDVGPTGVNTIGTYDLAGNGALTFRTTVAQMTRKVVQFPDGGANVRLANQVTGPNEGTTSTLLGARILFPSGAPASIRGLLGMGATSGADGRLSTTGKLRFGTTEVVYAANGTFQWIWIQINLTTSETTLYTEQEAFVLPFVVPASGHFVWLGGLTATSAGAAFAYAVLFEGVAAEKTRDELRAIWRAMGANQPW